MRRTLMMCMFMTLAALPLMVGAQPAGRIPEGRTSEGYLMPEGAEPRPSVSEPQPSVEPAPDQDLVREAQIALLDAGFDPGRTDGKMGPKTRAALRDFQGAQGLPQTGRLDETTQQHLLAEYRPEPNGRRGIGLAR
jgi:hypothetical protein